MLKTGDPMPDVTLDGPDRTRVRLRDRLGDKALVVYFYPKDDTPGCTVESCNFRDNYEEFLAAGADVVGVSADPLDSHERFAAKHRLPFTLLSDTDNQARKAFDVRPSFLGLMPGRATFVIDREGRVRNAFESQLRVNDHVKDALRAVREINAGR